MRSIYPSPLPHDALLSRYSRDGYTDCYTTDIALPVSHAQFVEAFYTSAVFGVERLLLKLVSKPSTPAQARQLALGTIGSFAAWTVEDRSANQLLLADFTGRTRSWLMVAPSIVNNGARTRLYFGSAVVPTTRKNSARTGLGFSFRSLLGFHRMYSRVLLHAAKSRLESKAD